MVGQGLVYLKVKQGFEFVYNGRAESDEDLLNSAFDCSVSTNNAPPKNLVSDVRDNQHVVNQDLLNSTDARAPSKADQLTEEIHKQGLRVIS